MYILLSTLNTKILEFEFTKELYINDNGFPNIYHASENLAFGKFYILYG